MGGDLLKELIEHIIAGGYAQAKDVDIFKDVLLDKPDDCIALLEYPGSSQPWYSDVSIRSVQVLVRSTKHVTASSRAWDIYNYLKPKTHTTEIAGRPCVITIRSTPVKIGVDELHRIKYAFNFGILATEK